AAFGGAPGGGAAFGGAPGGGAAFGGTPGGAAFGGAPAGGAAFGGAPGGAAFGGAAAAAGAEIPRRDRRRPGEPDDDYIRWDELANAWDDSGRSDAMLLSGKTIKEAEIWYERARNREPKPTALHREFIEASKNQKRKKA